MFVDNQNKSFACNRHCYKSIVNMRHITVTSVVETSMNSPQALWLFQ